VAEAAELRAEDRVGAGSGGGEVDMNALAGDGVLFEPQFGNGEAVDDVLRVEAKVYLAARGQNQFRENLIVGGVSIGGIETEWIAFASGDELRASDAEGGVRAGVAEVPRELHAGDFDLQGREGRAGVARSSPEALSFDGEGGEEECESGERKVLDAPEVGGFSAASREETGEEDEMREGEKRKSNPEVQEQMAVERGAVSAGIGGERPREDRHRRMLRGEEPGHRISILRVARDGRGRRSSSDWCALMKDHLPASIAANPEGAAQRMRGDVQSDGVGGAVRKQSDVFGQPLTEWIAEGDMARSLCCEQIDDLLPCVEAPGAAEFPEVLGEQRRECGSVAARGGLQELLLEVEQMGGEFVRTIGHGLCE
jgi:hypothetical protein